jgi:hypothetical protein
MRLKITGGELIVETDGFTVDDIKSMLRKMSMQEEVETVQKVREAGEKTAKISPSSSASTQHNRLGAKPKMPI